MARAQRVLRATDARRGAGHVRSGFDVAQRQ
jgi:hypothetical protein